MPRSRRSSRVARLRMLATSAAACLAAVVFAYFAMPTTHAQAQVQVVYAMSEAPYMPASLLQASDGLFYGTTTHGGVHGYGTVFVADPSSNYAPADIHDFDRQADGCYPEGPLVESSGWLYGTAISCGANEAGTVFRVNLASHAFETVRQMAGATDGSQPLNLTLGSDGVVYGAASFGGQNGQGTIFSISQGTSFTALYQFSTGANPQFGVLRASDGALYGTTQNGGTGCGVLFQFVPASSALNVLHQFDCSTDGAHAGALTEVNGTLYGATDSTIFSQPLQGAFAHLATLSAGTDGQGVTAAMVKGADNNLYGTTCAGGSQGTGTIYRLLAPGYTQVQVLFSLDYWRDGQNPRGKLVAAADGFLYGTTETHGEDIGSIFRYAPGTSTFQTLSTFRPSGRPIDVVGLTSAANGSFYGVSSSGGAHNRGTVFTLDSAGNVNVLHSFSQQDGHGYSPSSALVLAKDGNYYGLALNGGSNGGGTLFSITAAGAYTELHNFAGGASDGWNPSGRLLVAADGALYGTTVWGGVSNLGTIFRVTPGSATSYGVLYSFSGGSDGANPYARLAELAPGSLVGTTSAGAANGAGTVFRFTVSSSALSVLHTFSGSDGRNARDGLTIGGDGKAYGTTRAMDGGYGTVFSVDGAGAFQTVKSFIDGTEGSQPWGDMLTASDGRVFGATSLGGQYGNGNVFLLTVDGTTTTLQSFDFWGGRNPYSNLEQGSDGAIYGATQYGASGNAGMIFRVVPPSITTATTTTVAASPNPAAVGATLTITATVAPSSGSGTATGSVQFFDGSTSLGTQALSNGSAAMTTTSLAQGTHSLTATYSGDSQFAASTSSPFSESVTAAAVKTTPTITWANPADITYGTPLGPSQLNATASVPGTFAYTPPAGTALNVGNAQTLSTTFTPADTTAYNAATATVTINVLASSSASPLQPVGGFVVGSQPRQTAVDAAHDRMYVANGASDTISVVDMTTNSVVATFDARAIEGPTSDPQPLSLAFNSATNKLYVSFWGSEHRTWVIDTTTVQLVKIIPRYDANYDSLYPYNTVVDSVHNRVYVAHYVPAGTIDVIDGATDTITSQIKNGYGNASGMVADPPTNKVYVVYEDGRVAAVEGAALTETVIGSWGPGKAAIDVPRQRLYVENHNTAYMTVVDTSNDSAVRTFLLNSGDDVALSPNGNFVYGINYYSGGLVHVVDTASGVESPPYQLCSCGGGTALGVNPKNTSVYAFSYDGSVQILDDPLTHTTLTASPNPSTVGAATTLTAAVASSNDAVVPTGTVQFLDGTVSLTSQALGSSGQASMTTSSLSGGTHSLTVRYSGDSHFTTSTSAAVSEAVNAATPVITWSNPANITYGTSLGSTQLNATASVPGTFAYTPPAGTVLNVGANQSLSVTFTPTDTGSYTTATKSVAINVVQANTTTTLGSSPNPSGAGQAVTLTATVAAVPAGSGVPTGTVTFLAGSTTLGSGTLSNGVATLTTSGLPTGSTQLTAQYGGDIHYLPSTSPAVTQTVQSSKYSTSTTLTPSGSILPGGTAVKFTATVSVMSGQGTPTGTVQFVSDDGSTSHTPVTLVPVKGGASASATMTWYSGTHTVTAFYSGDSTYAGSVSPVVAATFYSGTAPTATTASVTSSLNPSTYNTPLTISATVKSSGKQATPPTGKIAFYVDGYWQAAVSVTTGKNSSSAAFTFTSLARGTHAIQTVYLGDSTYAGSASATLTQVVQ